MNLIILRLDATTTVAIIFTGRMCRLGAQVARCSRRASIRSSSPGLLPSRRLKFKILVFLHERSCKPKVRSCAIPDVRALELELGEPSAHLQEMDDVQIGRLIKQDGAAELQQVLVEERHQEVNWCMRTGYAGVDRSGFEQVM